MFISPPISLTCSPMLCFVKSRETISRKSVFFFSQSITSDTYLIFLGSVTLSVFRSKIAGRCPFALNMATAFMDLHAFWILLCLGNCPIFYEHGFSERSWIETRLYIWTISYSTHDKIVQMVLDCFQ